MSEYSDTDWGFYFWGGAIILAFMLVVLFVIWVWENIIVPVYEWIISNYMYILAGIGGLLLLIGLFHLLRLLIWLVSGKENKAKELSKKIEIALSKYNEVRQDLLRDLQLIEIMDIDDLNNKAARNLEEQVRYRLDHVKDFLALGDKETGFNSPQAVEDFFIQTKVKIKNVKGEFYTLQQFQKASIVVNQSIIPVKFNKQGYLKKK